MLLGPAVVAVWARTALTPWALLALIPVVALTAVAYPWFFARYETAGSDH